MSSWVMCYWMHLKCVPNLPHICKCTLQCYSVFIKRKVVHSFPISFNEHVIYTVIIRILLHFIYRAFFQGIQRHKVAHNINHTLTAVLKRWVLISVLNIDRSVQSQMCLGIEFQKEGAAMEKALSPQVGCLFLDGGDRRLALEERRKTMF